MVILFIFFIIIFIGFFLLIPKNDGVSSLTGGVSKTNLPFTKSQKVFFIFIFIFMLFVFISNKHIT